VGIVIKL